MTRGISLRDLGLGVLLAAILFQSYMFYTEYKRSAKVKRIMTGQKTDETELQKISKIYNSKVVLKVTPRIHVAVGFALANSVMIEGVDSVVIVDVTESVDAGKEVMAAFRNITKKPVKGIVYTHYHADHVYGAEAFIEDSTHPPQIWAHNKLLTLLQRQFYTAGVTTKRALRQFGVLIPQHINSGIGLNLRLNLQKSSMGIVFPNKLMHGAEKDISIAGVDMKLVHIPGETEDQIGVWLSDEKAFLCADDIYQAFPNLYAIRGTPSRDLLHWVFSLDRIIKFKPHFLVPSHTGPVSGEVAINDLLTGYRDVIQFVHDQTVRYMNKGYLPDEVAAMINIPEHLAAHPYLIELYGTVVWSVKGVFNSYMGWFSGDPVDLSPLSPTNMAEKIVELGGGVKKVTDQAEKALLNEDWQWALKLSSDLLRVDRNNELAKEIKAKSLLALGERQTSANGRNYYFTCAMEELGEISNKNYNLGRESFVKRVPLLMLFRTLEVRWNVEKCNVINATVHFDFVDTKETITMTTRNAVVIISDRPPVSKADIKVQVTSEAWRQSMISSFSALSNLALGELTIEGGITQFSRIMGCFDRE